MRCGRSKAQSSEVQTVAAFFRMAAAMDDARGRNTNYADKLRSCTFAGASRGQVVWIACEPERIDSMLASERDEKTHGAGCVMMSAMCGMDVVADVTGVKLYVCR